MNIPETGNTHATIPARPTPLWVRIITPLLPACLTFGPFFMVLPTGSRVSYAGAIMLGLALAVMFIMIMRGFGYNAPTTKSE